MYSLRQYAEGMNQERRPLTDEEKAECNRLKAEFAAYNAGRPKFSRLTQESAGAALGISQSAFSNYLNGNRPLNKEVAVAIARMLAMPVERFSPRLAAEIADMAKVTSPGTTDHRNVSDTLQPHRAAKEYPLISWVAAGCWQESCDTFQPGSADEWLFSSENAGAHGYWLEVKGPSMLPTFTPGMRILVRPEGFDLISGKYYIAKLLDTGETTFKQYVRDAGSDYLQPLNPAFPVLPITEKVQIIGQVIDAKLPPIF